jgi:hypothetical protein
MLRYTVGQIVLDVSHNGSPYMFMVGESKKSAVPFFLT